MQTAGVGRIPPADIIIAATALSHAAVILHYDSDFARAGFDAARDAPRAAAFQRQLAERLAALPGIEAVARARSTPLGPGAGGFTIRVGGRDEPVPIRINFVSPDYFALVRILIVRGRTFTESELAPAARPLCTSMAVSRRPACTTNKVTLDSSDTRIDRILAVV